MFWKEITDTIFFLLFYVLVFLCVCWLYRFKLKGFEYMYVLYWKGSNIFSFQFRSVQEMVEHNHKNPESVRLHLHLFRRLRNVLTSAINVTEEKDGVREVVIYRDTQLKIKLELLNLFDSLPCTKQPVEGKHNYSILMIIHPSQKKAKKCFILRWRVTADITTTMSILSDIIRY